MEFFFLKWFWDLVYQNLQPYLRLGVIALICLGLVCLVFVIVGLIIEYFKRGR